MHFSFLKNGFCSLATPFPPHSILPTLCYSPGPHRRGSGAPSLSTGTWTSQLQWQPSWAEWRMCFVTAGRELLQLEPVFWQCKTLLGLGHGDNFIHAYLGVNWIDYNGALFWVDMHMIGLDFSCLILCIVFMVHGNIKNERYNWTTVM